MAASSRHRDSPSFIRAVPRFLIIGFLALGIFLRVFHLSDKLYWVDEVATAVRISGYTFAEATEQLSSRPFFSVSDLHRYQFPNSTRTPADTIRSLAIEDSQHPPLYFLLVRRWVELAGHSIQAIRSFSVLASVLLLPALYWLCRELFQKPIVGDMTVVLAAVSPLQVVYAQEARPYSLWMLLIAVASALLARAVRTQNLRWLGLYGVSCSLGLYTHLLFGLVMLGHGLFVFLLEKFRLTRLGVIYLASSLGAMVSFLPWLYVLQQNPPSQSLSWLDQSTTFARLLMRWSGLLSRTFLDLGMSPATLDQLGLPLKVLTAVISFSLLGLAGYGLYHLQRFIRKEAWLFVVCMGSATTLPLMLAYFCLGKQMFATRYILPATMVLQIVMAFLLAKQLSVAKWAFKRRLWKLITVFVVACGIFSYSVRAPAAVWWNQSPAINGGLPLMAQQINRSDRPLVIGNATQTLTLPMLQTLGHAVAPKTQFQLLSAVDGPVRQGRFKNVYLLDPSGDLVPTLEKAYGTQAMPISQWFWQIPVLNQP
ncbi:MAG: glycosyltransferase family 39 protein [Cyanobacteria bacterium J06628_6]